MPGTRTDGYVNLGDHKVPAGVKLPPGLVSPTGKARTRTAAEEARTIVAGSTAGGLATLSEDGSPWSSLVTYGLLTDGSPVLLLSHLAEHGRNMSRDPRASLMVAQTWDADEPLARGRVTLLGRAEPATGQLAEEARAAHIAAVPSAAMYAEFGDFTLWVLRVERVRWVGGYGRMDSASAEDYARAEPDPTAPAAAHAIGHLNDDHPDALLDVARALGGHPDATAATCTAIDRYGLELDIETARGKAVARVGFAEPANEPDGLRAATVELTRRARKELA